MGEPKSRLFNKVKRNLSKDDGTTSIVSEDEPVVNPKKGIFTDIKHTVSMMKSKVSRSKGKMVRIMTFNFFGRKSNEEDHGPDPAFASAEAYPPLFPQLRDSWLSVTTDYIAKDLHRLIYRVTVKTSGVRNILLTPPPIDERGTTVQCATAVINLVKLLGRRMESEEISARINGLCDEALPQVDEKTDMIEFNAKLFKELESFSIIVRLLRCVHQSLVLKPYGILRTQVIKDKLTKDVRTEDGWQVYITVATEGFIKIVHVRKEQSIDMPTKEQPDKQKNHWEYEWEVSMTFDKMMNDMTNSRLSVTNLILSNEMDPQLATELKAMMQDGNLIVF